MNEPQQNQNGQWLKLLDAAQVLGVSEITLRRKIKTGKIAHDFRDGKYFIYLLKDERSGHYFEPNQVNYVKATPAMAEYYPKQSTLNSNREATFGSQYHPNSQFESELKIANMQQNIDEKDSLIKKLQREFEDQLTLIAFLEDTIQNIGNKNNASIAAKPRR